MVVQVAIHPTAIYCPSLSSSTIQYPKAPMASHDAEIGLQLLVQLPSLFQVLLAADLLPCHEPMANQQKMPLKDTESMSCAEKDRKGV